MSMKFTPLAMILTSACFGTGGGFGSVDVFELLGTAGLFDVNDLHE